MEEEGVFSPEVAEEGSREGFELGVGDGCFEALEDGFDGFLAVDQPVEGILELISWVVREFGEAFEG